MARSRTLAIEVVGDTKGLSSAFSEAERKADGFGAKVGRGAGIAALGVASVGVAAVGAAAIFGPKILAMGGELEAMGVKSKTVFEGSVGDVESWAAKNAKAMGLTNEQLAGSAASFGDLLKPMGFTADEAARMSTEALDLSGALSAWSGGTKSAAEVSQIMSKAMLGERDGLKELGISISEADVQARLAKKGQEGLTGAALEQAKAIATQELIFEKSADAQAAWNDGSMDGIKAQNQMKASLSTLTQSLVTALYPAMQAIVPIISNVATWLGTNLPIAMAAVRDWVQTNWPKIQAVITEALGFIRDYTIGFIETGLSLWNMFGERIMTVVTNAFDFIKGQIESVLKVVRGIIDVVMGLIRGDWSQAWDGLKQILAGVWDAIGNVVKYALRTIGLVLDMAWENIKSVVSAAWGAVVSTVTTAVGNLVGAVLGIPARIAGTISGMWSGIETGITAAKDWVYDQINLIVRFATGLPGRMVGIFSGMWDGIKSAFRSTINWVIGAWNGLEFSVPGVSAFGRTIGGFTIGVPDIPKLHSGGFAGGASFAGMRDDEVAAILQRGETVLTPGQTAAVGRGGGNVYNIRVEATPGTNRAELGRELVEMIEEFERSGGAAWRGALVS